MTNFNAGSEGVTETITVDVDEAAARRAAEQLTRLLTKAMTDAFRGIRDEMTGILLQTARGGGAQRITNQFNDVADAARRIRDETDELGEDIQALVRRSEAFKNTLGATGREQNLFSVFDTQIRRLLELEDDFKRRRVEIQQDPSLLEAYRAEARSIINIINNEQVAVGRIIDDGRSRNVAIMQQETTLRNAEIRTQGAFAVAREQRTARARIEIFRAATRQLIFLERSIRDAFAFTANAALRGLRGIASAAGRVGQTLTRSNRSINEGLNGALIQRETSIDRSFSRQTNIIRQETNRQTAIMERFQAQAATGVAGIATGRSNLGALLGGGLAFGGGFVLLNKLKQGFEESVNLNESLNKTRQIFGEASDEIIGFAQNSVDALFVTRSAALEAAANFGIFGRAAGLTNEDLADFSTTLVTLATDLASFNNTDISDATTAISAALRGESEPIRKYGVLLNEAVLQQRAMELGIIDVKRTLQPFERVLAANAEILAQTAVAQGDAARTADDFANSSRRARAASVETFSAIAENLVPFATFLTNVSFPTLQFLTRFIRNEVSPALKILRDGLIGAAIALGGLLAARAAGEALQFLAISLRLVLTPLGLFVTATAAVGAALNILARRSPSVRAAIDQITDALGTAFSFAVELAARLLDQLGRTLGSFILPLLDRFAKFLVNNLNQAIRTTFGFITQTAIPAVVTFAGFIANTLIPPLVTLADILADRVYQGFVFVRDAAVDLFRTVQPYIQPAIDGFARLGEAIRVAFTGGDFSGILGALTGVGQGIAGTFANIGTRIADLLFPQLVRVVDFIKDFFQGNTSASDAVEGFLLGSFQSVVTQLGFFIGNLATDPRLIQALEVIIGLAVLTGANFVKGIILGIVSNLDELSRMFGNQFRGAVEDGIGGAFSARNIIRAILLTLGAAAIGTALFTALRRPLDQAGKRVGATFISSLGTTLRTGAARNNFAGAFIGGFERFAVRELDNTKKALEQGQIDAANRLRLLGVRNGRGDITGAFLDIPRLRQVAGDAQKELKVITDTFGQPAVAAGSMRAQIDNVFRAIQQGAVGTVQVLQGEFRAGFENIGNSVRLFRTNVAGLFRDVAANFKAVGLSLGQAVGSGIISGIGAVFAGQQLGSAGGVGGQAVGLAGILASGLFAGSAFSAAGPQVATAVGGLVVGLGLLTAGFTRSKEAAKEAQERVDAYTDALIRNTGAAEQRAAFSDLLVSGFRDLGEEVRATLIEGDFDIGVFSQTLAAGGADIDAVFTDIFSRLGFTQDQISAVIDAVDGDFGRLATVVQFPDTFGQQDALRAFGEEAKRQGLNLEDLAAAAQFLDQQVTAATAAEREAADVADATTSAVESNTTAREAGQRAQGDYLRFLRDSASTEAIAAQETRLNTEAQRQAAEAAVQRAEGIQQAIDELNRQRTQEIQTQINDVSDKLGAARTAAEDARTALEQYLSGDYANPAQRALDDLVLSIPNIATQLQEAATLTPTIGGAQTNQALAELGQQINTALADPSVVDAATARARLAPFFTAIEELRARAGQEAQAALAAAAADPENQSLADAAAQALADSDAFSLAADQMIGEINTKLDDGTFNVLLQAQLDAVSSQEVLQQQLDLLELDLGVKVFFDEDQIRQAFRDITGFDLEGPLGGGATGQGLTLLNGQQQAIVATTPTGGFTQPVQPTSGSGGVVIENFNVNGAQQPTATGGEVLRSLRLISGANFNIPAQAGVLL